MENAIFLGLVMFHSLPGISGSDTDNPDGFVQTDDTEGAESVRYLGPQVALPSPTSMRDLLVAIGVSGSAGVSVDVCLFSFFSPILEEVSFF